MKPHRQIRTSSRKGRKFAGHCEACNASLCSCKAYQYTDDTNAAINASSPFLCASCYEKKHGVHIKSHKEAIRDLLIEKAHEHKEHHGLDNEKLIRFIMAVL